MSQLDSIKGFIEKLLNRSLSQNQEIRLSSVQKLRFASWMKGNNINFDPSIISGKFLLEQLICARGELELSASMDKPTRGNAQNQSKEIGVGVDIQLISEIFSSALSFDEKCVEWLGDLFTAKEIAYARSKDSPQQTLAGIFCAKEAVIKAGEVLDLSAIEILPDEYGVPSCDGYQISISHSGEYAIAIAIKPMELKGKNIDDGSSSIMSNTQREGNLTTSQNSSLRNFFPQFGNFKFLDLMIFAMLIYLLIR